MYKMHTRKPFLDIIKSVIFWRGTFFAILLTCLLIIRVALPLWLEDKENFATQLELLFNSPTHFDQISGGWAGWSPSLRFKNFIIHDAKGRSVIFSAEEVEIRVNIFQSLMKRRFISKRITLSDSEFSILREVDGSLRLEGGDSINSGLLKQLLRHENFSISAKAIPFHDKASSKTAVISNFQLKAEMVDDVAIINGEAELGNPIAGKIHFNIEPSGELSFNNFTGQIAVWITGIDPSALTGGTSIFSDRIENKNIEFLSWMALKKGKIENIDYKITAINGRPHNRKNTATKKPELYRDMLEFKLTGHISRSQDKYIFYSNFNSHPEMQENGGHIIGLTSLSSTDPTNFLLYGENIPLEFISYLNLVRFLGVTISNQSLFPRGSVGQLGIVWDDSIKNNNRLRITMDVENFSIRSMDNSFGLLGTGFKIQANQTKGNVQFEKTEIDLYFPNQKTESFSFSNIDGTLNWQKNNLEGLTIFAERLEGFLNEKSFQLQTVLKKFGTSNPGILFSARLPSLKIDFVKKMIPRNFFSGKHLDWLDSNFKVGNFTDSQIYFKGPFFLERNSGEKPEVLVQTKISEAEIKLSEEGPLVGDLFGTLDVAHNTLSFEINSGKIADFEVSDAAIFIPNLSKENGGMRIFGNLVGDGKYLENLKALAPFENLKFKYPNAISLSKPIVFKVDLQIDRLKKPNYKYVVAAHLQKNELGLKDIEINPIVLSGVMYFSNNGVNGTDLEASFANKKFNLEIETNKQLTLRFESISKQDLKGELVVHSPKENTIPKMTIKSLHLAGQEFEEHGLTIATNENNWVFDLKGNQILGTIFFSKKGGLPHYKLELEKLDIQPIPNITTYHELSHSPPNIDGSIKSLIFRNRELGELNFKLSNAGYISRLEKFELKDEKISITMEGAWERNTELTSGKIDASGENLTAILSLIEVELAGLEANRSSFSLDGRWKGSPYDFEFANIEGTLNFILREGRLLDLEPGTSRLFGLMSLQALPRRLSLDFNDLFRKGLFFDFIDGEFLLQQGTAMTENMVLSGPSVLVEVSGKTNLKEKTYDQKAFVTPKLSDSIPIASALLGPVGLGAGAAYYLSQKVFKSIPGRVDEILKKGYLIQGDWDNPIVSKIED